MFHYPVGVSADCELGCRRKMSHKYTRADANSYSTHCAPRALIIGSATGEGAHAPVRNCAQPVLDVACKNTIVFDRVHLIHLSGCRQQYSTSPSRELREVWRRGAWSLDLGNLRPCRVSAVNLFIHETMCRCTRAQSTRFYLIITNSDQTQK